MCIWQVSVYERTNMMAARTLIVRLLKLIVRLSCISLLTLHSLLRSDVIELTGQIDSYLRKSGLETMIDYWPRHAWTQDEIVTEKLRHGFAGRMIKNDSLAKKARYNSPCSSTAQRER